MAARDGAEFAVTLAARLTAVAAVTLVVFAGIGTLAAG